MWILLAHVYMRITTITMDIPVSTTTLIETSMKTALESTWFDFMTSTHTNIYLEGKIRLRAF